MRKPSYISLHRCGELARRAEQLEECLTGCMLCPHACGVNRLNGERGFCRAPATAVVHSFCAHGGEEAPISGTQGSGTIFFSYCNSRCSFCQNHDISHGHVGTTCGPSGLADMFLTLQDRGCHNINLVSPTHFLPTIVRALTLAVEQEFSLPLVYNTNGYERPEILELLDGIIDIYMPDFKFNDDEAAQRLTRIPDYPARARAALKEMYRQVGPLLTDEYGVAERGMLIRHLVLPNDTADTEGVLTFIAELDPELHISLMGQYFPAYQAPYTRTVNRRLNWEEYERAQAAAEKLELSNVMTQNVFFTLR